MTNTQNTQITKSDLVEARIRVRIALDAYEGAWMLDAFSDAGALTERAELRAAEAAVADLGARFAAQGRAL
jgi:hypothetical protein